MDAGLLPWIHPRDLSIPRPLFPASRGGEWLKAGALSQLPSELSPAISDSRG